MILAVEEDILLRENEPLVFTGKTGKLELSPL
jgi:hypothetical protein